MAKSKDISNQDIMQVLQDINTRLKNIENILDMHTNDIRDILIILNKLESRMDISDEERKLAAVTLEHLIKWARAVAKKIDVPLRV